MIKYHLSFINTPGRRQSKVLLTIDERGSKIARKQCLPLPFVASLASLVINGNPTIFDRCSSIVLTFSIAVYPV